jgi:hypothetical protein
MRLCRVTCYSFRTFQEFLTHLSPSPNLWDLNILEHSKAVERLERLERTGPRGERSKAVELEIPRMVS